MVADNVGLMEINDYAEQLDYKNQSFRNIDFLEIYLTEDSSGFFRSYRSPNKLMKQIVGCWCLPVNPGSQWWDI